MLRKIILYSSFSILSASMAYAQTPIDSIKLAEPKNNDFSFSIQPSYSPESYYSYIADPQGNIITESNYIKNFSLGISGKYTLDKNMDISFGITPVLSSNTISNGSNTQHNTLFDFYVNFGISYTNKNSFLNQGYNLSAYYPFGIDLNTSFNYIRDPLSISPYFGYKTSFNSHNSYLYFGSGINFIANDRINLSGNITQDISISSIGLESTILGLSTVFTPDDNNTQFLNLSSQLSYRNNKANIGFSISYTAKNP